MAAIVDLLAGVRRASIHRSGMRIARRAVCALLLAAVALPATPSIPLDRHPAIQYATRPAADRVARLMQSLGDGSRALERDERTGYLQSLLDALGISAESQLLVFSKTGVQRAYTGPHTPRAIYFDESVAIGYVPGAPAIEIASQDPRQGVVFYTLDQNRMAPMPERRTSCLTCHVSAATLDVPGMIVRSHTVGEDGNVLPQAVAHPVDHRTPHPDRWGGWLVTFEGAPPPYAQRAHEGNITFERNGNTTNGVFIDWIGSAPQNRGYLSPWSDITALLAFAHQMHAINLITRLGWQWRVDESSGRASAASADINRLAAELADYLLFADEASLPVPLTPRPGFAAALQSLIPADRRGRSFAQFDLVDRLLKYPCSYMIYTPAFDALPAPARQIVYGRMIDLLSGPPNEGRFERTTAADRRAILEILRETKSDFPQS